MMDLQERVRGLEARVESLEQAIVSGVPGNNIADRFNELHNRVDIVGKNVRSYIDKKFDELSTEMDVRFAKVDERFDAVDERFTRVDERFDAVDERFTKVDERFDKLEASVDQRFNDVDNRLALVMAEVSMINGDSKRRDQRIDKLEKQLETQHEILLVHDERFDRIESLLVRIEGKLPDQQPN
jgi:chromosome segregation ATPase